LSLGGETGSRGQASGLDVTMEGFNQGKVFGLGGLLELGGPSCHSDNL